MTLALERFIEVGLGQARCLLPCTAVVAILRLQDGMIRSDDQGQPWLLYRRQRWQVLDVTARLGLGSGWQAGQGFCVCYFAESQYRAVLVSAIGDLAEGVNLDYHAWQACLRPYCKDGFAGWLSTRGSTMPRWLPLLSLSRLFGDSSVEPNRELGMVAPSEEITGDEREATATKRLMILKAGLRTSTGKDIFYGISLAQVAEVMKQGDTFPIPTATPVVLGGIHWHGRPVPVFNLDHWLGFETKLENRSSRVLVIRLSASGAYAAFAVGAEMRVERELEGFRPMSPALKMDASLLMGSYRFHGGWLLVPDFTTLLMGAAFV